MAFILNLDTSTQLCSVSIAENGITIAEKEDISENRHATQLTALINNVLADSNLSLKALCAIAISSGPGSYTGLRIGTSVAKGLCYGLDIPLIGVSTLQGLAYAMAESKADEAGIYVPMLDARNNNAYMAIYDAENNIIEKDKFTALNVALIDNLRSNYVKTIYLGGSGATKFGEACLNINFGTVIENIICRSTNINMISYKLFLNNQMNNLAQFEPFYLKEFEGRMKIN
jgi:tRNA threonylcarbamoyladenosine biosynthesis protein TsaB